MLDVTTMATARDLSQPGAIPFGANLRGHFEHHASWKQEPTLNMVMSVVESRR